MLPLLALLLLNKPWNGITPGVSTRDQVLKKFGDPSKVVIAGDVDVLAYQKGKLIRGTTQTQFRVAQKTNVVERIDVFPEPRLSLEDIAAAYGPECTPSAPETPDHPCYLKRTDEKRFYVVYVRLGLAAFFDDAKIVHTLAFLPEKK